MLSRSFPHELLIWVLIFLLLVRRNADPVAAEAGLYYKQLRNFQILRKMRPPLLQDGETPYAIPQLILQLKIT